MDSTFYSEEKTRNFINDIVNEKLASNPMTTKKSIALSCKNSERQLKDDEFSKLLNGQLKIFPMIELLAIGLEVSPYEIFFAKRLHKDFIKYCESLRTAERDFFIKYVTASNDFNSSFSSSDDVSYHFKGTNNKLTKQDMQVREALKELFYVLDPKFFLY